MQGVQQKKINNIKIILMEWGVWGTHDNLDAEKAFGKTELPFMIKYSEK